MTRLTMFGMLAAVLAAGTWGCGDDDGSGSDGDCTGEYEVCSPTWTADETWDGFGCNDQVCPG